MREFLSWKLFNSERSRSFCPHIVTLGFDPWKIKGHNPSGSWNRIEMINKFLKNS